MLLKETRKKVKVEVKVKNNYSPKIMKNICCFIYKLIIRELNSKMLITKIALIQSTWDMKLSTSTMDIETTFK